MKKILLLAILLLAIHYTQAQGGFNYQAALKQNNGSPIANQAVKVTIEIRQGSANGTVVHTETQNVTTSSSGIVNIKIAGDGGSDGPKWSEGPFFLGAKFDGVDGEIVATPTEISAVPFALYAETS